MPLTITKENEVCACWDTFPLNPKQLDMNPKRVAEISAIIVAICLMCILVPELMIHYPKAHGACFATFGVVGIIGATIFCIALVKHCQNQNRPGIHIRL